MTDRSQYGGPWTLLKLDILKRYLNSYTTALKNQSFTLIYIDAFAGSGKVDIGPNDERREKPTLLLEENADYKNPVSGSAKIALEIMDKPFDQLIFIEKDTKRCEELQKMKEVYEKRDIQIFKGDANDEISSLNMIWKSTRGVIFLDPYATQVKWATIEYIARTKALDAWILFPINAIKRMLPTRGEPERNWNEKLNDIFGGDEWQSLYEDSNQQNLMKSTERDSGTEEITNIYEGKLRSLFGDRLLNEKKPLKNTRNTVLFYLYFCAGNPRGIKPAHDIAEHIIDKF